MTGSGTKRSEGLQPLHLMTE